MHSELHRALYYLQQFQLQYICAFVKFVVQQITFYSTEYNTSIKSVFSIAWQLADTIKCEDIIPDFMLVYTFLCSHLFRTIVIDVALLIVIYQAKRCVQCTYHC